MLRDVVCLCSLFQHHLHNDIQMKSLKLIRTVSALGRINKECCKAHPSERPGYTVQPV